MSFKILSDKALRLIPPLDAGAGHPRIQMTNAKTAMMPQARVSLTEKDSWVLLREKAAWNFIHWASILDFGFFLRAM